jgi:RsiW-degrading membrane proteinase PrsW (M82 family)
MNTLREKITFLLTASAYLLFHLGKTPSTGSYITGTLTALFTTLPFEAGITCFILYFIRRLSGEWPPWDRILRIFFTVGILFGLVYSLYIRGIQEQERLERETVSVSRCRVDDTPMVRLYWA